MLNASNKPWYEVCTPCGRYAPSTAYDPADRYLVLFGGAVQPQLGSTFGIASNDTWKFQSGVWSFLPTTSSPSPRWGAALTWDAADGYLLLFGGCAQHTVRGVNPDACANRGALNDTWAFRGGVWTPLNVSGPNRFGSHLGSPALAYDAADGYAVLVASNRAGTFTWKYAAGTWKNLTNRSAQPEGVGATLTYDAADGYVVFFGGKWIGCITIHLRIAVPELCNQTWTFVAGHWTNVTSLSANRPFARELASADYDPNVRAVVLFGGFALKVIGHPFSYRVVQVPLNDTWEFKGGRWTNVSGSVASGPRITASLAFDARENYSLLTDGIYGNAYNFDTAYSVEWSFGPHGWKALAAQPVPSVYAATLAFEPVERADMLFGGVSHGSLSNATWLFSNQSWTLLRGAISPGARMGAMMDYDPSLGGVLLFGGYNGSLLNDTWEFAKGNWTQLSPSSSPPAREFGSMTFDAKDNYTILFGGNVGAFGRDTWVFHAGSWKNLTGQLRAAPAGRYGASLAYDSVDAVVLLFGGFNGGYLGDTWEFSAGKWSLRSPVMLPNPRDFAVLVSNPASSSVLLFGGYDTSGILGDSWSYAAGNWVQNGAGPPPTELASAAYDSGLRSIVMVGGVYTPYGPNGFGTATGGPTWEY
jgi:hypothetical protein